MKRGVAERERGRMVWLVGAIAIAIVFDVGLLQLGLHDKFGFPIGRAAAVSNAVTWLVLAIGIWQSLADRTSPSRIGSSIVLTAIAAFALQLLLMMCVWIVMVLLL